MRQIVRLKSGLIDVLCDNEMCEYNTGIGICAECDMRTGFCPCDNEEEF